MRGQADPFGAYEVAKVLPNKIARLLFEFLDDRFRRLNLPDLRGDRSQTDIHIMLNVSQVTPKHS